LLEKIYADLLGVYHLSPELEERLWSEIKQQHSAASRHYHSLNHLQDLHEQLLAVKPIIQRWDIILFTLFYHDIVYHSTKSNNEEKSAEVAQKRMKEMGVAHEDIQTCYHQILATKSHQISDNPDTNLFTDADLSILGRDWGVYDAYCQNVRKEYSIYPKIIYKQGRKKVVKHFLGMERIYKTEFFYNQYEGQARDNLKREMELLNN